MVVKGPPYQQPVGDKAVFHEEIMVLILMVMYSSQDTLVEMEMVMKVVALHHHKVQKMTFGTEEEYRYRMTLHILWLPQL